MSDSGINSALGMGAAPAPETADAASLISAKAAARYVDGYRAAGFIVGLGTAIKIVGVLAGLLVFLVGISETSSGPFGRTNDMAGFVAFFMGVGVWLGFFIAGVIVSAQGQQLKASLDSAVHSSPFLGLEAKAKAMNLT